MNPVVRIQLNTQMLFVPFLAEDLYKLYTYVTVLTED